MKKKLIWGIYLVIFCLPLYLVRFEIFGIPTTVLEVLIYILFIFWLVKRFRFKEFKKMFIAHCSLFIAIFLIIIGVSLATIFSSDLRTSAGIWKAWFIDPLLFFVILIATIKNIKQIKGVFYSLFLSGTIVSIISFIYLIQGKFDPVNRLQAFYDSPNYLAMYLAPMLILGCGLWFTTKKQLIRILLITSYVLLITNLFFTKSFGAWVGVIIALAFGLIVYFFKKPVQSRKKFWAIFIFSVILLVIIGCFSVQYRSSSLGARLIIWEKAISIYKINPFLGIGPGTFETYFPPYPEWGVPQPHNIFLAFLLQTGLVGFIGFIWLLIYFFKIGFKLLTAHCSLFTVILVSIMFYILIHGLVDTTYWKNDLAVIFWTIVALLMVLSRLRSGSSTAVGRRMI